MRLHAMSGQDGKSDRMLLEHRLWNHDVVSELLKGKPIEARKAATELSVAAFRIWLLLHFETDLTIGRTKLAGKCGVPKSTFDRLILELRRKAFLTVEDGQGNLPCKFSLIRVLDASGRCKVHKQRI